LERAGRLKGFARKQWLTKAASELAGRLDAKQREVFRRTGRLAPEQLFDRQRDLLKHIARLAFADRPGLDPKMLELKGVSLGLVPAKETDAADEVVCSCASPTGESIVLVTVPLPSPR